MNYVIQYPCQGMVGQTGELEVFHSVQLKYSSKNLHFHYTSMVAKTQLAIFDHNEKVASKPLISGKQHTEYLITRLFSRNNNSGNE
ncbi:hypothetical protein QQF64_011616 [Cirrhinus molitorella]|uniref:Uncharacterized protein n=2 Tax=Cirrhinus molitorella TaxID=172907 RepID=A0ABR3M3E9_9TELE|nr:hypothetical protein Q8A67_019146 [Cirrhinus molitorella]